MTSTSPGWLGVLPEGWDLVPSKAAFAERREPNRPDDVHLTPSQIHGVLPQSEYVARTGNAVVQNLQGQDSMKHVEPDDFIIHLRSFQGGIERSTYSGKVSTAYTVLAPKHPVVADYFRWLLKSDGYIQELRTTTNQLRDGQSIKFRDFAKVPLPLPPPAKQRAITHYLDRETARIDTLIEQQQSLIGTLHERRRAVIDHALATGAEPVKFSRVFAFYNGDRGASYPSRDEFVAEGVPFVNAGHLQDGLVSYAEMNYVTSEKYREMGGAKLLPGDVLFCLRGSLGKFGQFDGRVGGALASSLVAMRRIDSSKIDLDYFLHFLASSSMSDAIRLVETGTAQPNLSVEQLARLTVPLPPVRQQRMIAGYLDEQTGKIDTLVRATERFIELARERRSALITAAVTGQMDVRGVA